MEVINKQLINNPNFGDCNYSKCNSFNRYYDYSRQRKVASNTNKSSDSKLEFYRDVYDNIHHWLFHLFHVGMRTYKNIINGDGDDNDDIEYDDKYIDYGFKRIKENISSKEKN